VHGGLYSFVVGLGIVFQQGRSRHDLAGLAIPTLWNVDFQPGLLHRVITVFRQAFDRRDGLVFDDGYGQLAGANGSAVEVNGTVATLGNAAAVFGSGQLQVVAQDPKQRRGGVHIDLPLFAVDVQVENGHSQKK